MPVHVMCDRDPAVLLRICAKGIRKADVPVPEAIAALSRKCSQAKTRWGRDWVEIGFPFSKGS